MVKNMACNCKNKSKTVRSPKVSYNFAGDSNFIPVRYVAASPLAIKTKINNFYSLYGIYNYGLRRQGDTFYIHQTDYEVYKGRLDLID